MTVKELSPDQLDELRHDYFDSENPNGYTYAHEIPDSELFDRFMGVEFVNEDFCCHYW